MMSEAYFTFFDTAVGRCGIAWGGRGVIAVLLPERSEGAARTRLLRRLPKAREAPPPPDIQRAIDGIVALLGGASCDLSDVALDMEEVPAFNRRVYEIARAIPPGATLSYGEIATRLGDPRAARDVGQALGKNPFPIVVPCHRVLAAGGKLGGFSARGGVATKLRLLEIEGALTSGEPMLFDELPLAVRSVSPNGRAARSSTATPASRPKVTARVVGPCG
jgi:methylated-DNA-[protein]-cysteine S-methyltransferase